MTYRERREARAARLRGWAEKRYAKAETVNAWADQYRGDTAFNTQPGHIPERARLNAAQERSWESVNKAASMESHASTIETQLDRSIYSDDPDAIERLRERIAGLEAERERVKAANVTYRRVLKGITDPTAQETALRAAVEAGQLTLKDLGNAKGQKELYRRDDWRERPYPSYVPQNLGGNITRNRQRLTAIESPTRDIGRI